MLAAVASIAVVGCYVAHFDGEPRPLGGLVVALPDTAGTVTQPTLLQRRGEPTAVYVVTAVREDPGGLVDATRIDVGNGARSPVQIAIGPDSGYLPFLSAEVTGNPVVELRGVSIPRPTLHLFRFPGGGGPGVHLVDSSTGVVQVATARPSRRVLVTKTVLNSSTVGEMRSRLWSDPAGRVVAFLWRRPSGWSVCLFSLGTQTAAQRTESL